MSYNVGLPAQAILGGNWSRHRQKLRKIFMDLMGGAEPVVGLLLCEVGNLDDLCDEEAQCRVEDVIAESFAAASKGTPTFYWSGETVTAWLRNQQVHPLPLLTKMKKVHEWRCCERLVLTGAAEHGHPKLLVYNTHQPASDNRKFPPAMRINFCAAVLEDAVRFRTKDSRCIGFIQTGDANCTIGTWASGMQQTPDLNVNFRHVRHVIGVGNKGGDVLTFGAVGDVEIYDNTCRVQGREKQHEPVIAEWRYKARSQGAPCQSGAAPQPPPAVPKSHFHSRAASSTHCGVDPCIEVVVSGCAPKSRPQPPPRQDLQSAPKPPSSVSLPKATPKPPPLLVSEPEPCQSASHGQPPSPPNWEPPSDHSATESDGGPSPEPSPRERDRNTACFLDTGWALVQTSALLTQASSTALLTRADTESMTTEMAAVEVSSAHSKLLKKCTDTFFTERAALQSTPREGMRGALRVKDVGVIHAAWEEILHRRRKVQADDRVPITERSDLAQMHSEWMNQWMAENLTEEQRNKPRNKRTSMFNAHLKKEFGGKHFVMALWQTGITWAPSCAMTQENPDGAAQHVATELVSWIRKVMLALEAHKKDPATVEATRRSGDSRGMHGLTSEELHLRTERDRARRNFHQTRALNDRLNASKGRGGKGKGKEGKGKGKGEGKGKGKGKGEPKTWYEMTGDERWWILEFRNGNLWHAMKDAESQYLEASGGAIEAGDFRKAVLIGNVGGPRRTGLAWCFRAHCICSISGNSSSGISCRCRI